MAPHRSATTWLAAALAAAAGGAAAADAYRQTQRCGPDNFDTCFDFFTDRDPTNGFVQYVNQSYAESAGLYRASGGSVVMGADSANVYALSSAGRPSLRLESKFTQTHGLFVLDLKHMPVGCGTWPAFWSLGPSWPDGGEIDMIEGVNNQATNLASLHTGGACTVAGSGQSGALTSADCAVADSTSGCSTRAASPQSYGAGLNAAGGGVYAMEWTSSAIRTWFFARGALPASIAAGRPDPAADFGLPQANFAGSCDVDARFRHHRLVFDLTFCGDWAGNTFAQAGCPASGAANSMDSCRAFVAGQPGAFRDAYWDIADLRVYAAADSSGAAAAAVATPVSSVAPLEVSSSASVALGSTAPAAPAVSSLAQPSVGAGPAAVLPSPAAAAPLPQPAEPAAAAASGAATPVFSPVQAGLAPAGGSGSGSGSGSGAAPAPAAPAAPSPAPANTDSTTTQTTHTTLTVAQTVHTAAVPATVTVSPSLQAAPSSAVTSAPIQAGAGPAGAGPAGAAGGAAGATRQRTVEAGLVETDAAGVAEVGSSTLITQTVDHFRRRAVQVVTVAEPLPLPALHLQSGDGSRESRTGEEGGEGKGEARRWRA